jgi:hypothetical protein
LLVGERLLRLHSRLGHREVLNALRLRPLLSRKLWESWLLLVGGILHLLLAWLREALLLLVGELRIGLWLARELRLRLRLLVIGVAELR